jgi:hypothetical protein
MELDILISAKLLEIGKHCFRKNIHITKPLHLFVLPHLLPMIKFRCKVAVMEQLEFIRIMEPIESIYQCKVAHQMYSQDIFSELIILVMVLFFL